MGLPLCKPRSSQLRGFYFLLRCLKVIALRQFAKQDTRNLPAWFLSCLWVGRGAGIATRYGLHGPRIESLWWRDFPHPCRPDLRPTQPPIQRIPVLSRRLSGRGVAFTTHLHLAPGLKKVELHLYSPVGPSSTVLGWTLLLPLWAGMAQIFNPNCRYLYTKSSPLILRWRMASDINFKTGL